MFTLYYGNIIHTPKLGSIEILLNHLVGINSEGVIEFVQATNGIESALEYVRAEKALVDVEINIVDNSQRPTSFLVPGFVDTHIHASQYPNIGIGSDLPLLDWLTNHTFPLESRFNSTEEGRAFAKEVYSKVIDRTLSNGTTCASYFATVNTETTEIFAELVSQKGQRAFVGKVCMDCNQPYPAYKESPEETLSSMKELIQHCDERYDRKLVCPIITPRFAPSCSRDVLQELGEMAVEHDLPIQTHVSENLDEISLVKSLFTDCEDYTSVYDKYGLVTNKTILAHAIHLEEQERKLISAKGASLSHCPCSNSFITSGEAPVKKYLYEDDINVSLGTDLSGGYEQSILGVLRSSIMVSHHLAMGAKDDPKITIADALYMATMGGARACNLDDTTGTIEVGKKFDAQLIDLDVCGTNVDVFDFQKPKPGESEKVVLEKVTNLLRRWIFSGDDRNCVMVWCDGKIVVDKKQNELVEIVNGKDAAGHQWSYIYCGK